MKSWTSRTGPVARAKPPSCQVMTRLKIRNPELQQLSYNFTVHTGNGNASNLNGVTTTTTPSNEEPAVVSSVVSSTSQYCPRHHHHTQQQQPQRQTPSPNKRHRLTPRPHNIQRPCLDFEKMQQVRSTIIIMSAKLNSCFLQIKKRVVTSWRPQGAELSLFCW